MGSSSTRSVADRYSASRRSWPICVCGAPFSERLGSPVPDGVELGLQERDQWEARLNSAKCSEDLDGAELAAWPKALKGSDEGL